MAFAMGISIAVIPVISPLAEYLGLIDQPDQVRKVHLEPIPRIGGWGVALGALVPLIFLVEIDPLVQSYVVGSLALLVFGTWDDAHEAQHYTKFLGQFIAVGVVVFHGGLWIEQLPFFGIDSISPWIGMPFTFFAIVGMINALNTSDGLDGLAAGESLLTLIVIVFLAYIAEGTNAVIISMATIGGILGFLRYNTHPARVFMGDAGSQFVGFTLGFLAVLLTQRVHPSLSPAITLLFLGLPIIDIIATMVVRTMRGQSLFHADRNHIHHRLLVLGFKHYETVIIIYLIQAVLVISAIFLRYEHDTVVIGFYLSIAIAIFSLLTYAERRNWRFDRGYGLLSRVTPLVTAIRENTKLALVPFRIVQWAVPLYILVSTLWVATVPRDFGVVAAVLFVLVGLELTFRPRARTLSIRGGIYVVAIFSVYLMVDQPQYMSSYLGVFNAFFFVILALAISLTVPNIVHNQDGDRFEVTPMDYLIVFGVMTIGIFGSRFLQMQELCMVMVKAIILLYGCELLISRLGQRWNELNVTAVAALGILGMRGLIS